MSNSKYPWDEWLIQKEFTLKKGCHYACQTYAMAIQAREQFGIRGYRASILIEGDILTIKLTRRKVKHKKG